MLNTNKAELEASLTFFENNFLKSNITSNALTRLIESVARLISPAYWTYVHVLTANLILIQERIDFVPWVPKDLDRAIIDLINDIGPLNVASIDWREKMKIKETIVFANRLKFIVEFKVYAMNYFNRDAPTMVHTPKEVPLNDDKWDGNFF